MARIKTDALVTVLVDQIVTTHLGFEKIYFKNETNVPIPEHIAARLAEEGSVTVTSAAQIIT